MAERLIRDLRFKAGKLRHLGGETPNWCLKQAVHLHNHQYNRSIGMAPVEADKMENAGKVLSFIMKQRSKEMAKMKRPLRQLFQVGDWVRIRQKPVGDSFFKIGAPTTSAEPFRVIGVKPTEPIISYFLESVDRLHLPGSFLETDLVRTSPI